MHAVRRLLAVTALAAAACQPAQALVFNLSSTGDANADAGFARAAAYWSSVFSDPVEVNVQTGFSALAPGVLGQAGSAYGTLPYSLFRTAAFADAVGVNDVVFTNGLPVGPTYSRLINRTANNPNGFDSSVAYVQRGIEMMGMTTANAKALGLLPGNLPIIDAGIEFSSLFTWDFDPSDGINPGAIDFVGVAIHELAHAMGFISGVDDLDFFLRNDTGFDESTTPLDFTRCSATSRAAGADMDFRAENDPKDFALDGGRNCTALVSNAWSTGAGLGDGRQASHWKDNFGIGIMDPTAQPAGNVNIVTFRDIQALDVIGWSLINPVPLPGTLVLALAGIAAMAGLRRRRAA